MKNIVIIGGTKGIGKAIVDEIIDQNKVTCLSRNKTEFNHSNYTFHEFDALSDEYPEVDRIDCLIYCPGSINLKPISTLSLDDFRNDFELNVIGAIKAIKKYLPLLKMTKKLLLNYLHRQKYFLQVIREWIESLKIFHMSILIKKID